MLTVFSEIGTPEYLYFTKTNYFEQVLRNRGLSKEAVISQELSLEAIMLLAENKSKVFILCLYKKE